MRLFVLSVSLFIFLFVDKAFGTLQCSGQNEIEDCIQECPPEKTCRNRNIKFSCMNKHTCKTKCVCKDGFYRIDNGDCVSRETCDRCPDNDEVFNCGSACDTTCATLNQSCPIRNIKCNEKCYCRSGYARNDSNICIPISECKPNNNLNSYKKHRSVRAANQEKKNGGLLCDPNEEYQECKRTCPPDTCISLVARFKCDSDPPCEPGCVCKSGYLRKTLDSPCMPMRQCPQLAHSPDFN